LNKALLDTDTYSEILKAVDPNVTRNATAYRQARGVLTLSAVTVMEVTGASRRIRASESGKPSCPPSPWRKCLISTDLPPSWQVV
jgi:hypothetical protein